MVALGRNKPLTLIEYRSPSTLNTWTPNLYIDIGDFYKEKITSLHKRFKSQIDAIYFSNDCIKLFHEDYINKKKGVDYVEMFNIKTINI
jgi:hypothetical protein